MVRNSIVDSIRLFDVIIIETSVTPLGGSSTSVGIDYNGDKGIVVAIDFMLGM